MCVFLVCVCETSPLAGWQHIRWWRRRVVPFDDFFKNIINVRIISVFQVQILNNVSVRNQEINNFVDSMIMIPSYWINLIIKPFNSETLNIMAGDDVIYYLR